MSFISAKVNHNILEVLHTLLDNLEVPQDTQFYDANVKSAKDIIINIIDEEKDEAFEEGKEEGFKEGRS